MPDRRAMRSIRFVERGTPVDAQLGRILGRVTEDEALSLRERLRAVEVQVDYLRRDFDAMGEDMKSLASSLGQLTDLVSQVKGACWMIGLSLMVLAAISAYAPTLVKSLLTVE